MFLNGQMVLNRISCSVELGNCCRIRLDCRYYIDVDGNLTAMGENLEEIVLPKLGVQIPKLSLESKFKQKALTDNYLSIPLVFFRLYCPSTGFVMYWCSTEDDPTGSEEILGMFPNLKFWIMRFTNTTFCLMGFVLFIAWFRELFITNSVHYQGR